MQQIGRFLKKKKKKNKFIHSQFWRLGVQIQAVSSAILPLRLWAEPCCVSPPLWWLRTVCRPWLRAPRLHSLYSAPCGVLPVPLLGFFYASRKDTSHTGLECILITSSYLIILVRTLSPNNVTYTVTRD